jgi:hypothetical protein
VLNIQAREVEGGAGEPPSSRATNFSVLRLKRDISRRSNIGLLYTRRMETGRNSGPPGETVGLDGLYSFSPALNVTGYYARTRTRGVKGGDDSHMISFEYGDDRYGLLAQHTGVGVNFNPAVGFLRRSDFKRSFVQARFSPRPSRDHWKPIRRFVYQANVEYITNNQGRLDFREQGAQFIIEMVNNDELTVNYTRDYEYIPRPFLISTSAGVTVPVGGYTYQNLLTSYTLGMRRFLSGTVSYQEGQLYGGTRRTVGLAAGRMDVSPQLAFEPGISANWVSLPWGDFTSTVITKRTTFTINPRSFVSALVQYNSTRRTFSTNARFRWEYRPGSELFVVYSDGRDTEPAGFPQLVNRAFIVKINRLLRF